MSLYYSYSSDFPKSSLIVNIYSLSVGIRRSAFEKLAALAVKQQGNGSDLSRLSQQTRSARQADGTLNGVLKDQSPTSRVPMVRIYAYTTRQLSGGGVNHIALFIGNS